MKTYIKDEEMSSSILNKFLASGVKGGQKSDGNQKDGIFAYEKGRKRAVYDLDTNSYINIEEQAKVCDPLIGDLPEKLRWKEVNFSKSKGEILKKHFSQLTDLDTKGAEIAKAFGAKSKQIGLKLVEDKIAESERDVNSVLSSGFYHAYGPINEYFS